MKEHITLGEIVSGVFFFQIAKNEDQIFSFSQYPNRKQEDCRRGIECIIIFLPPNLSLLCTVKSSSVLLRLKGIHHTDTSVGESLHSSYN